MVFKAGLLCLCVAGLNALVWRWANPPLPAAPVALPVQGVAYNAFQRWQSPLQGQWPQKADVEADLEALSGLTVQLRTYSASELPVLPGLARERGLRLTAGVWLDTQALRNERELQAIESAVQAERRLAEQAAGSTAANLALGAPLLRSIERVIAGNETQLHRLLKAQELAAVLKRLRSTLDVPVSTAEPWHVWLAQPELVEQVDFIAVHLLPYWEGVPAEVAVHEVWRRYDELRLRYPDKPVVIAEAGWPSTGPDVEKRVGGALNRSQASPLEQARFVREFVASARLRNPQPDYFLMEAIDQPWKTLTEGPVGAHWGVLDARRTPKFAWSGPVERDPYWRSKALAAAVLGVMILWPFLMRAPRLGLVGRWSFGVAAQVVASVLVVGATLPLVDYLQALDALLLALLMPALLLMAAILIAQAFEFAELYWDGSLHHREQARPWDSESSPPLVSVHLACCNEPAEMVLASIRSLQGLDWPRLEILVVDNNSSDPGCWQPVKAYVEQQRLAGDERLRFIHLPQWPGYKAGALNEALRRTDRNAQWVAVVDADYVVAPAWLRRLGGWFSEPAVAVLQSPQAHRAWGQSRLARMMNWEYEGFFRLGMHHRHERNAIVQHGTMTIIRRDALEAVGGWDPHCVCEDTELGLRLLEAGWRKVYVDEVLGAGLVPQTFLAYQRQRERWARGGIQILRGHAAALIGRSALSLGQRYHFLAGWLPWIGDTLHLIFSITALLWSAGVLWAPSAFSLPSALMALPLGLFFVARLVLVPLLYSRRVNCSGADVWGAAWAGMALSHCIARGVLAGCWGGLAQFHVTDKGGVSRAHAGWPSVWQEALLGSALLGSLLGFAVANPDWPAAQRAWCGILCLQALPYAAACSCAWWGRGKQLPSLHTV
jgi:cellulose synthase/poly-beta-1,6-N-acetylglucosamine synthase-like glycosyltransferase/exo-beta-1,3-glucanase (GH17 family)